MSLRLLQVIKVFILTIHAASFWIISFSFQLTGSQGKLFSQTQCTEVAVRTNYIKGLCLNICILLLLHDSKVLAV